MRFGSLWPKPIHYYTNTKDSACDYQNLLFTTRINVFIFTHSSNPNYHGLDPFPERKKCPSFFGRMIVRKLHGTDQINSFRSNQPQTNQMKPFINIPTAVSELEASPSNV